MYQQLKQRTKIIKKDKKRQKGQNHKEHTT
jgi:hypothetical protein